MLKKVVDTILPTTMVGSYPRPHWFNQQLLGRDIRVAFKDVDHAEAYHDAVAAVIRDQEEAGLDIVTDGQMCFDDYVGVDRLVLLVHVRAHRRLRAGQGAAPLERRAPTTGQGDRAARRLGRRHQQRPGRAAARSALADLYKIAERYATRPVKVSVGAGPVNLAWHVYFQHYKDAKELTLRAGADLQQPR